MTGRTCLDCAKPISAAAMRCVRCAARDPARRANVAAARKAAWDRTLADPEQAEIVSDRHSATRRAWLADPENAARAARVGRATRQAHPLTPAMMQKQVATRAARFWCPEAYRDLNEALWRRRIRLCDRRRVIAERVAADERARLAAMTPFERQLDRVARGAQLIERVPMPSREYGTLGGVGSALL